MSLYHRLILAIRFVELIIIEALCYLFGLLFYIATYQSPTSVRLTAFWIMFSAINLIIVAPALFLMWSHEPIASDFRSYLMSR